MKPFKAYIIGPTHLRVHCTIDPQASGTNKRAGQIDLDIGGAGHNIAQAFKSVGAIPKLLTVLPETAAGEIMRSHMQRAEISCDAERSFEDTLPAAVEHWSGGPRSVFTLESNPMETHEFNLAQIEDGVKAEKYDAVIISGGVSPSGIVEILEIAKRNSLQVGVFATDTMHTDVFLRHADDIDIICMTGAAWGGASTMGSIGLKELSERYRTIIAVINEDLKITAASRTDTVTQQSQSITAKPSTLAAQLMIRIFGYGEELCSAVKGVAMKNALDTGGDNESSAVGGAFTHAVGEMVNHANHDPLTGLLNRGGMERSLGNGLYAVIVSDIDHFKSVNDTYGHSEGDRVLRDVAVVMKRDLRSMDLAVRWGGEEFVLLLPRANMKAGKAIAERIRARLQETVSIEERVITGSFGVTTADLRTESIESAVSRADEGLYYAKEHGRNQVVGVPDPNGSEKLSENAREGSTKESEAETVKPSHDQQMH